MNTDVTCTSLMNTDNCACAEFSGALPTNFGLRYVICLTLLLARLMPAQLYTLLKSPLHKDSRLVDYKKGTASGQKSSTCHAKIEKENLRRQ